MTTQLDRIRKLAESDPEGATIEMAEGLARGDRSKFKQGYEPEAAVRAAEEFLGTELDEEARADALANLKRLAESGEHYAPAGR